MRNLEPFRIESRKGKQAARARQEIDLGIEADVDEAEEEKERRRREAFDAIDRFL